MSHEFEAPEDIPGLPGRLPEGERLLWQGSPSWRGLLRRALHADIVAGWFVLLAVWSAVSAGGSLSAGLTSALMTLAGGVLALAILAGLAVAMARSTIYSITSKRVVMRYGVALPVTLNLPFGTIGEAGLRRHADGTGDIALGIATRDRIAWLQLWPHARPWRLGKAEPMLRAVPDAARVAETLGRAYAAARPGTVQAGVIQPDAANEGREPAPGRRFAAAAS